jgi:hypothetical protein
MNITSIEECSSDLAQDVARGGWFPFSDGSRETFTVCAFSQMGFGMW